MRGHRLVAAGIVITTLLALGPSSSYGQPLTQYAHTAWRFQEGFFDASPISIAQTTDGFLWLGTLNGLLRFDGVQFESWNDRLHELNACCAVSLLGASDGSLWIGTGVGLVKLSDGTLSALTKGDARYNHVIEDRSGRIWASRSRIRDNNGPLCEVQGTGVKCHGEHDGLGCKFGDGLVQDNSGTVWVADQGKICSWNNGVARVYSAPVSDVGCRPGIEWLSVDSDQSVLIGCSGGLRRLEQGRFVTFQLASIDGNRLQGAKALSDRRGGLWIATRNDGLYHIVDGVADHFGVADGLSDDTVFDVFEDREGNVWAVTPSGIDRFHQLSVVSFSSEQGFRGAVGSAVLASRDGHTVWTSGPQGLSALTGGKVTLITRQDGLPGQQVTGLFEDDRGVLWVGIDQNLFAYSDGRFIKTARSDGRPMGMVIAMAEDARGSIWIVTATGSERDRLLRLDPKTRVATLMPQAQSPGHITSSSQGLVYLLSFNLGEITIVHDDQAWEKVPLPTGPRTAQRLLAADDSLFVGTTTGLYRLRDRKWSSLTMKNGLPCDVVQDQVTDHDGGLWLHMACGFVRISKRELDAWSLDPSIRLNLKLYDALDGARPGRGTFSPAQAKTANGQLWFATGSVLQMIDPQHLAHNTLPPPVHIQRVTADDTAHDATNGLRLPSRIRNLTIDYTALSLVAPAKMRFRYRLEGQDPDWKEVINDRRVQYSNLPPGPYRFHVIASNNSGVWNETGAAIAFSIAPAYYQTRWFQALVAVSAVMLMWSGYRLRVRQVAHQYQRRLDERVNERTRIARELHDTLLQSFHGLLLRFQTVSHLLDPQSEARQRLDSAIAQAAVAITEGRDAVQALRMSTTEGNDLAKAITTLGAELAAVGDGPRPELSVAVEGTSREMHPIVRDEIYKIAAEAVRNAFKHALATRIEVEIRYDDDQLRLRLRDDGKGIDQALLVEKAVEGHYGLHGMRERAALIGGTLAVWSNIGTGTAIELRVPAKAAYAGAS